MIESVLKLMSVLCDNKYKTIKKNANRQCKSMKNPIPDTIFWEIKAIDHHEDAKNSGPRLKAPTRVYRVDFTR